MKNPAILSVVTLAVGDVSQEFVVYAISEDGVLWFLIAKQTFEDMALDDVVDSDAVWAEVQVFNHDEGNFYTGDAHEEAVSVCRYHAAAKKTGG